ncbi:MAG: hypothetical protein AUK47_18875 [Deltaproteobacteria bacterium CG2_30_63_29]|nr:MAG: hypothetical protein AUK47_18875 [Deltaproteobacteria bacterium CG2_30_63_29]PIV99666.1 MAG: hypothetical protein COW42_10295 [Deltaproteobacteria bacterium CG17_big_fil_post_rev_8_21_14_2_50_63_7]PJB34670.1 MAG: hypothetical protein CO108_27760 [Deltaproteobacteria bacterium CG_4_9_14_3_um_filter_63_12]
MSYTVHIERRDETGALLPLDLEAWKAAVNEAEGVRLATSTQLRARARGAEVSLSFRDGDAELYFPEAEEWHLVFMWSTNGTVMFNPGRGFTDSHSYARHTAVILAKKLGAELVGDDGERYTL